MQELWETLGDMTVKEIIKEIKYWELAICAGNKTQLAVLNRITVLKNEIEKRNKRNSWI